MTEACGAWGDSIRGLALVGGFRLEVLSYGVWARIDVCTRKQTGRGYTKITLCLSLLFFVVVCYIFFAFVRGLGSFLTTGTCVYGGRFADYWNGLVVIIPTHVLMNASSFR